MTLESRRVPETVNETAPRRSRGLLKLEGNIVENPIFALWIGKPSGKASTHRMRVATWRWDHDLPDGRAVKRVIEVKSPDGILSALDLDVLVALFEIRERNRDGERVYFSRREIGNAIGWKAWGSQNDREVKESLKKLHAAAIWFTDSWYDRQRKSYTTIEKGVHLLEDVEIFSRRREGYVTGRDGGADLNWARLSQYVLKSMDDGHFIYVDFKLYRALPSGLARRLYLYLTAKRGGRGGAFPIGLQKLANHMPLTCRNLTWLRHSVERAATALRVRGLLRSDAVFECKSRSEWVVHFDVAPRAPRQPVVTPREALDRHVARFYEVVDVTPTRERAAQDLRVIASLKEQNFTDDDVKYAISYMLAHPRQWKDPRSLGILPHVMPFAVKEKKKREAEERRRQERELAEDADRVKRARELERDRRRDELATRKLAELAPEDFARIKAAAEASPEVTVLARIAHRYTKERAAALRDDTIEGAMRRIVVERYANADELAACELAEHRPD